MFAKLMTDQASFLNKILFLNMKSIITVLFLVTLCHASNVAAEWSGRISQSTIVGRPYGQIVSASKFDEQANLKIVCFQEDSFWLYLDDKVTDKAPQLNIVVSVDKLPSIGLNFLRRGENYTITNQASGFWNLIAQMAAGSVLNVDMGDGSRHQYSLNGFTSAFLASCDWIDSVDNYRSYLSRYR